MAVSLAVPASASAQSLDELGRPTEPVLQAIENLSEQQWIPEETRGTIARLVGFFRGSGEPGTPLPENGPVIAQFAYPTIMQNCIDGEQTAVGAATAVPGPAGLPLPGIPGGHLGFIFTALGTEGVAPQQVQPMTVDWFNINNGRRGTTVLSYNGINAGGPATLNGVADTGPG
ncbi:Rv1157c family protein, partial [Dietzia natronolimnaea]